MDPHSPHPEIARKRELYRTRLEAVGHDFAGREIPMARLLALARTDDQAEAVARRGAGWMIGAYAGEAVGKHLLDPRAAEAQEDPVERYLSGMVVHGTPERVVDELQRLESEMFLDYLMCAPLSQETFRLFTDEVLPKLL